jgi:hypothetical protein
VPERVRKMIGRNAEEPAGSRRKLKRSIESKLQDVDANRHYRKQLVHGNSRRPTDPNGSGVSARAVVLADQRISGKRCANGGGVNARGRSVL